MGKYIINSNNLDKACRYYQKKKGLPLEFWDRCSEAERNKTRREVLTLIALATGDSVRTEQGE